MKNGEKKVGVVGYAVAVAVSLLLLSSCGKSGLGLQEASVVDSIVLEDTLLEEPMVGKVDFQLTLPANIMGDTIASKIASDILEEGYIGDSAHRVGPDRFMYADSALAWEKERVFDETREDFADNTRAARRMNALLDETDAGARVKLPPILSMGNEETMRSEVVYNKGGVFSYKLSRYKYNGGAHGNTLTKLMSYDLKTGNRLLLEDVFIDGYEPVTTEAILQELMAERGYKSQEQMLMDGFFRIQNLAPTPNFCVKEDTVVFLFNAYEIATFSLGAIEVKVPMYKLRTVLRPETKAVYKLMKTKEAPESKTQFK